METFVGSAGLLFVGTITPGPNNLIVMHAAATRGWATVARLVVGIVLGGVGLLLPATGGVASLVRAQPATAFYLAAAGCVVLAALGISMIAGSLRAKTTNASADRTVRAREVFAFQFLNPKAWVLVFTVTAAAQSTHGTGTALLVLVPLFIVIPTACLCVWSAVGLLVMRRLQRGTARRLFDATMGGLLCVSAVLLLAEQILPE